MDASYYPVEELILRRENNPLERVAFLDMVPPLSGPPAGGAGLSNAPQPMARVKRLATGRDVIVPVADLVRPD